jgi:hypothetical protein
VIVDEAHHIRNVETFAHQGVRYFCDNAGAVLLLTATPVQLGSDDLFTLLNVLRPDLIIDHASFESKPSSETTGWMYCTRSLKNMAAIAPKRSRVKECRRAQNSPW